MNLASEPTEGEPIGIRGRFRQRGDSRVGADSGPQDRDRLALATMTERKEGGRWVLSWARATGRNIANWKASSRWTFHRSEFGPREITYYEAMDQVFDESFEALRSAQASGVRHVLFRHGSSTSRPGQTTARSQVRGLMRSPLATPYIIRSKCIQHESVFVAAIRSES